MQTATQPDVVLADLQLLPKKTDGSALENITVEGLEQKHFILVEVVRLVYQSFHNPLLKQKPWLVTRGA